MSSWGTLSKKDDQTGGLTKQTQALLEGVMKQLGQRLTASADFVSQLPEGDRALFHELGSHQLKGKNQLVSLLGLDAKIPS